MHKYNKHKTNIKYTFQGALFKGPLKLKRKKINANTSLQIHHYKYIITNTSLQIQHYTRTLTIKSQ